MDPLEATATRPGLRERKKRQTRDRIACVALKLFADRGYHETTLAEIAEAAEVAPRTIFAYFDSKEDILLCEEHTVLGRLKRTLDERPAGTTTVDAIREFVSTLEPPDEAMRLRKRIVASDSSLQMKLRARHGQVESMLAESIAKDLGAEPGDLRALLAAASVTAAFNSVRDRFEAEADGEPPTHEQMREIVDQVLEFLRGGLAALQRDPSTRGQRVRRSARS